MRFGWNSRFHLKAVKLSELSEWEVFVLQDNRQEEKTPIWIQELINSTSEPQMYVAFEQDEDGIITGYIEGIDFIVADGQTPEELRLNLATQLINYAVDYITNYSRYSNAPNTSKHAPYILHIFQTVASMLLVDPSRSFEMQWKHQIEQAKSLTIEQKLEKINRQIIKFENKYGGTFYKLFGQLSDYEIEGMSEAVDIFDWKELEQEKEWILSRKGKKN